MKKTSKATSAVKLSKKSTAKRTKSLNENKSTGSKSAKKKTDNTTLAKKGVKPVKTLKKEISKQSAPKKVLSVKSSESIKKDRAVKSTKAEKVVKSAEVLKKAGKVAKKVSKVIEKAVTAVVNKKIKSKRKPKAKEGKGTKEEELAGPSSNDIILSQQDLKADVGGKETIQKISPTSLPDVTQINYKNFKRVDKPEPVKIEAEPTILVKTEIKKAEEHKAEIKNKLFEKCLDIQNTSVNIAKKAMDDAQESANEEKGSMEEKFDSFRESMHIARDMYARQYSEGMTSISILKRINPNLEHNTVILGSVVYTELQNYFISVSLGEIIIDNQKFITISTLTPLFQALSGKKKGDKFKFRDKLYSILDVF